MNTDHVDRCFSVLCFLHNTFLVILIDVLRQEEYLLYFRGKERNSKEGEDTGCEEGG